MQRGNDTRKFLFGEADPNLVGYEGCQIPLYPFFFLSFFTYTFLYFFIEVGVMLSGLYLSLSIL